MRNGLNWIRKWAKGVTYTTNNMKKFCRIVLVCNSSIVKYYWNVFSSGT